MQTTTQGDERFLSSDIFDVTKEPRTPRRDGGAWTEPARDIPIYHRCEVPVVGGGPAGTAAAAWD